MGWLQWLKGSGTQADRYLKLAVEDVSDFRLAVLLRELINRGHIADAARDAEQSYKRRLL
jgi:molybdenum-dependent DNA-binding transcriptional regulator ModE